MKQFFGKFWLGWAALWFASLFILFWPLFYVFLSFKKTYPAAHFLRRIWGFLTCLPAGLIPIITKDGYIPKNRKIIYCANHSSYLDILTCGTYLPGFNFFMAKMELSHVPLFRKWFKTLDVPVKRENLRSAHAAFHQAAEKMNSGAHMIIFPEGKIPSDTPRLHKFKPGAFRLAIQQEAVIIPVTLPDNHIRMDIHKWIAIPGPMRLIMHKPIDTKGMHAEDATALEHQVFEVIEHNLKKRKVYA
jgi:1-acyl-sn-glycerol-3-phosphate acyltransferase